MTPPPGPPGEPLIVTAQLPSDLQAWASQLRLAHYPPERNFLDAHVTLFHALPPSCEAELRSSLARMAHRTPPRARLEGVMSLGRGTALRLSSPELLDLREELAEWFHGLLSAQDRGQPRLHVTVQNKVEPAAARRLQAELAPQVRPRNFAFPGLALHAYLGGPWRHLAQWSFRG